MTRLPNRRLLALALAASLAVPALAQAAAEHVDLNVGAVVEHLRDLDVVGDGDDLDLACDDFRRAFAEVDVILGPTSPTTAFPLGAKADDPVAMYLNDIYTIATNLAGLPGLSLPALKFLLHQPILTQSEILLQR